MTGFDETVPPDIDPSDDETSTDADSGAENDDPAGRVAPAGGPAQTDADDEAAPMAGDPDIRSGHLDE